jgi:hypothetical protein
MSRSRINFGTDLGQRGLDTNAITERYADVYIGFTLTPDQREPWFKKSRIE